MSKNPNKVAHMPYFFDQMPWLLYLFRCSFFCGYYWTTVTIRGWCLFFRKAQRHQQRLDKVHTSETVMVASHIHTQPLSPAVSRGNNSHNTNSPSTTVIRNHSHRCAQAVFTSHGYYSMAVFISFESFRLCGYYSRAASI